MSNDPVDGGTVRYHRATYRPVTDEPWLVWFTEDQADPYWFTAEQGEAMGLTPPEPAPLVVTSNGHSIELSDEWAEQFIVAWTGTLRYHGEYDVGNQALARLLRDARQDPQPASGEPGTTDDDDHYEAWKADMAKWKADMAKWKADRDERDSWKETARQYAENADYWRDRLNDHKASLAIQAFTAPDEDEAVMMESLVARIADLQAKVDSLTADQPEQDDTTGFDFDALPIGTVLTFNGDTFESTIVRQLGGWRNVANGGEDIPTDPNKWKIAYFPPPMSPGECLRDLLSGRDDADELIEYAAATYKLANVSGPGRELLAAIGDAARGGA